MNKLTLLTLILALVACTPAEASIYTEEMPPTQPPAEEPTATSLPPTKTPSPTASPVEACEDDSVGVVLLVFGQNFDYRHYDGTSAAIKRAGYCTLIASDSLDPLKGMYVEHGFEASLGPGGTLPDVEVDLLLEDVRVADYDAIVFISDTSMNLKTSPETYSIARQAAGEGVVLAAQEFAVLILATAGVLEGVEVTANPLLCQQMETDFGAICTNLPVKSDRKIITADPSFASASFAKAIIGAMEGQ